MASFASLITGLGIARALGPKAFGEYGIIQSTLSTFFVFVGPAASLTATKTIAEMRRHDIRGAGDFIGVFTLITIAASAFLAAIMWAISGYLAISIYGQPDLAQYLRIASIAMFATSLGTVQQGALAGFDDFKSVAKTNAVRSVSLVVLTWAGVRWAGLQGAVWALALSAALGVLVGEYLFRRITSENGIRPRIGGIRGNTRLVWKFSLPAMLTSAIALIAMWLGGALLIRQEHGLEQFGIFTAANQWRTVMLFIPNLLVVPFLPRLSSANAAGDVATFRRLTKISIAATTFSVLATAVGAAALADIIMKGYGTAFADGKDTLRYVVLATVLCGPSISIIQAINALGRPWAVVRVHLVWAGVFCVMLAINPNKGALGLSQAYVASYAIQLMFFWKANLHRP